MHRNILLWGLILAAASVLLGAFGAHAIKNWVPAEKVAIFETGVRYQFMHAIALILLSVYAQQSTSNPFIHQGMILTARFFLWGILCFSGSLYFLSFQPLFNFPFAKWVGPITPLGGLLFLAGWASWVRIVWLHKVDK